MNNRIEVSDNEIINILDIIKNKDKKRFIIEPRDFDNDKNPKEFMIELGIDYNDVINIIKSLTIDNYVECILDSKRNFKYLYVFKDDIEDINAYIKIGFLYDTKSGDVHVVSFHRDMNSED